jgi:uncharacterized membrane protein (UPF0127 family)
MADCRQAVTLQKTPGTAPGVFLGVATRRVFAPYDIVSLPQPNFAMLKRLLLSCSLLAAGASVIAQNAPQNLPTIKLAAGIHNIAAQVAQTPEQRATGLMFRTSMPTNEGMLFVFDQPAKQCFWMKNTLLPLSAAFISDNGTVVNIEDMQPQSLDSHCSAAPVRYVLEMNRGWFAKRGIKPGAKLTGAPFGS